MPSILWVPVIFAGATWSLYSLSRALPDISQPDGSSLHLKFPSSLDDLRSLSEGLRLYKEQHLVMVLLLFGAAYLYKQTFAIPGSVFMNLLGGAIFGTAFAFPLACVLTAAGATNCYLLSRIFGKAFIQRRFSAKLQMLQNKVSENSDGLFFFLLFLRLFPMTPNWFLNMSSPLLNIPLHLFFPSVLIGLMPYNFMCVQTGSLLSSLTSVNEIFTTRTMLTLAAIAVAALLPGVLMRRMKNKRKSQELLR